MRLQHALLQSVSSLTGTARVGYSRLPILRHVNPYARTSRAKGSGREFGFEVAGRLAAGHYKPMVAQVTSDLHHRLVDFR
jgi:hypothetical protein